MDERLKQRLVGAAVIISLGVIFLPVILDGGRHAEFRKIHIKIPPLPEVDYDSSIEPLAGEARPAPPIAAKSSAESVIFRPPQETASDAAGRKRPLPVPQAGVTTAKPMQPDKTREAAADSSDKNLPQKTPVANTSPPASESAPAFPAGLTPKTAPSEPQQMHPSVTAWVIQVGSFSSRTNAVELRDKLRKSGFTSFVESFEGAAEASHRVRIGPEVSRSQAEKSLSRLQSRLAMNGIIVSYP